MSHIIKVILVLKDPCKCYSCVTFPSFFFFLMKDKDITSNL